MLSKDNLGSEIHVGVTFASLMSATSLFFTGIIIGQYRSFNPSIKVPLIFLIISTYSFIFAATIFSNAGTEVTLNRIKTVEKYLIYARNIEEFLGLYLFMLATPMVIGSVTQDSFLKTATIIIALTGITLYSQSKFSILQRELSMYKKRLLTLAIVALSTLLYVSQSVTTDRNYGSYTVTAIVLLLAMMAATIYFSLRSRQYQSVSVRLFKSSEAEALSKIILKNIGKFKSARYSQTAIEAFRAMSPPEVILQLAKDKQVFVAEFGDKIVGFACLHSAEISHVFTDPQIHQKGVGRALVEHAEIVAKAHKHQHTHVSANKVDHGFYQKLGYIDVKKFTGEHGNKLTLMKKSI